MTFGHLAEKPVDLEEESAALIVESTPIAGLREALAGEAASKKVYGGKAVFGDGEPADVLLK